MNTMFLTLSAGGGHVKAAEAVQEHIDSNYKNSNTCVIDVYKHISPILDKVVIGSYLKALKKSPKLWGKLYEMAENGDNMNDLSQTLHKVFSFKIKKLIHQYKPDIIVCTHPFPLQMVCNLKKNKEFDDIPIVNIITDYGTHSLWINKFVNAYIVAHEGLVYELQKRGVDKNKIYPFGIPVSNKFFTTKDRNKLLNNYNLLDKTTFLVMGGSLGIGKIKSLFTELLQSTRDFQIVVVCGNNEKLKKQLESLYAESGSKKKVLILGYTDKINELMSIADILITKPGGLSITEAMLMKTPMVLISPIPGQEEKNANYLLNNGAAIKIDKTDGFENYLFQYLGSPIRIKHIKEMCEYLSKPNSTSNIAAFLNKLYTKSVV